VQVEGHVLGENPDRVAQTLGGNLADPTRG
jgi:hypothetical protein